MFILEKTIMKVKYYLLSLALIATLGVFAGCSDDDDNPSDNTASVKSCEGCHTNYDHLKLVHTPDTEIPAGGCGGAPPYYEPFDRVFMDKNSAAFKEFKESDHGKMKCTDCHNGTDGTDDKAVAHGGNFIKHPSDNAVEKCGTCHSDVSHKQALNLHQGWGQKRKVCQRSGKASADDFESLPEKQRKGYEKNCAICHASCGDCHVNRPNAGGGGLAAMHKFTEKPDMLNTCIACHSSRGGHAYLGVATGTKPDVHLTKANMTCTSCHSKDEIHGSGAKVEQRYAYDKLPKCENCHPNVATSNDYHGTHINDFNCQVCHSQEYNSCGSCHIGGEGARIHSYQDFKIALNPIPTVKTKYKKLTLVRRNLAAPDNWSLWDLPEYANFAAHPTYNFTTPHNISRWTKRTEVVTGKGCGYNCHIRKEGDIYVNKNYYLFDSDLLDWERSATQKICVDGKLPSSWGL